MKYYIVKEWVTCGNGPARLFIVEKEEIAKDFCKKQPTFYYQEFDINNKDEEI